MTVTRPAPARLIAEPDAVTFEPVGSGLPGLGPVDWNSAGLTGPGLLDTPAELTDAEADPVVIAWADAEWAATHHVFCASDEEMPHRQAASGSFPRWDAASVTSDTRERNLHGE